MRPYWIPLIIVGCVLSTWTAVAQDEPNGEALYQENCAECHGEDLRGGITQSMVDGIWQFGEDPYFILSNTKNGIASHDMPAFGGILEDDELEAIVDFILSVGKSAEVVKPPPPERLQTIEYEVKVDVLTEQVEIPWAIAFPDEHTILLTERPGRLRVFIDDVMQPEPVSGTPKVLHEGQGGLMDVAVDPNYAENGWIYLAYSHGLEDVLTQEDRLLSMTRLVRGRIRDNAWVDEEVVFEANHDNYNRTRHHYGCRIVFDPAGHLYFSVGERGYQDHAQDLTRPNGKIHRIWPDGRIPEDNPFTHIPGAVPSIYTYGNRNAQGLSVHPETGKVWETEHGPMGGDELNLIVPGRNYGWPAITYGIDYSGRIVSKFTEKQGMEQPILYWRPSTGVCGIEFYEGDQFPKWRNSLLVGSLKYQDVRLLKVVENRVIHEETIFQNHGRVRDVGCSPDGAVYILLSERDSLGKVVKLSAIAEREY